MASAPVPSAPVRICWIKGQRRSRSLSTACLHALPRPSTLLRREAQRAKMILAGQALPEKRLCGAGALARETPIFTRPLPCSAGLAKMFVSSLAARVLRDKRQPLARHESLDRNDIPRILRDNADQQKINLLRRISLLCANSRNIA